MQEKKKNITESHATSYKEAVQAIKAAILYSQCRAARAVNAEQLSLYYGIGKYTSINSRKGYWGTGAIAQISEQLQKELPGLRGFSASNIKNMRLFFEEWEAFTNRQPVADDLQSAEEVADKIDATCLLSLNRQPLAGDLNLEEFLSIGFSHHIEIISKTKSPEERIFYIRKSILNRWSKYTLRTHLEADDFHHQGVMPNNFAQTLPDARQSLRAIEMFKDQYLLDFINVEELNVRDEEDIDERIVEKAIIHNVKNFIMTFGQDFTFVGNQFRLEVVGHTQIIDLLFFNRELNSLVAVELKAGSFKPSYLGQLNLYLSALDDFVRKPHENPSIGIILCKNADKSFVEYAVRDYNKPIGVATYRTKSEMPERLRQALPDMDELKKLL